MRNLLTWAAVAVLLAAVVNPAAAQLESTKIAFASDRAGDFDLYQMNPDGSGVELIAGASAPGAFERHPAWSWDGRKLAFASDRDGDFDIYVLDICSGVLTQLTHDPATDYRPAWSPDDSQIVFETYRDGKAEIYRMEADGANEVNLTNHPALDGTPDWSPDGQRIAFHSRRQGTDDVYLMNPDGSGLTKLTNGLWANWSRWSPDGSQISFSHSGNAWVMNADGSNRHTVLTVPGSISPYPADWSPDGSKIVIFTERFTPDWEIFTIDSGGGGLINLTNHPSIDWEAAWSPPLSGCVACVGFEPPMADYPVTVRGPRALPLRAVLLGADGVEVTDAELSAAPVVQVWFDAGDGNAVDVTGEALPVGLGDDGNQFVYTGSGRWQFNLKTSAYSSPGTYTVFLESGDSSEYGVEPTCVTEFVVR